MNSALMIKLLLFAVAVAGGSIASTKADLQTGLVFLAVAGVAVLLALYLFWSVLAQMKRATDLVARLNVASLVAQTDEGSKAAAQTLSLVQAQATRLADTSTAVQELATSIQDVSADASRSAAAAEQTLANAQQGTAAVRNTIQGMQRLRIHVQDTAKRVQHLHHHSQEVGEIGSIITDLADQTSVLALNITAQVLRAGAAGQRPAIAAAEVEHLAKQVLEAAQRIARLVTTIQRETREVVTAIEDNTREMLQGAQVADQAGQTLGEIERLSTQLGALMKSITDSTAKQADGSATLSKAMQDMSSVTQQTVSGTKQVATSIQTLATMAETLRNSVNGHRSHGA